MKIEALLKLTKGMGMQKILMTLAFLASMYFSQSVYAICIDWSQEDIEWQEGYPPPCPEPIDEPPLPPPPPPSDTPPPPVSANVKITRYTKGGSFDKPVVLIEGFDPMGAYNAQTYKAQLGTLLSQFGQQTNGRDLVIIEFIDYTKPIQQLADDFKSALLQINYDKVGDHPTAVIGYSAGGIISRWGLKEMENAGIDHETSLYISYDSPHRGAVIPGSMIDGIRDIDDKVPDWIKFLANLLFGANFDQLDDFIKLVKSPISQQLIIGTNTSFVRQLESLGYPELPVRATIALGASDGSNTNLPKNAVVYDYRIELGQISNEYQTLKQAPAICNYPCDPVRNHDYDRAPGSTVNNFEMYWKNLEAVNRNVSNSAFDLDVYYKNTNLTSHTFIPTLSALDLKNYNLNAPITHHMMEKYSPFDEYFTGSNIGHDKFYYSQQMKISDWLNSYHQPGTTAPDRSHKSSGIATVKNARAEWFSGGQNFIQWSAVPGATKYEVFLKSSGSRNFGRIGTTTRRTFMVNVDTYSIVAIRACNNDQCGFSDTTVAYYRPGINPF